MGPTRSWHPRRRPSKATYKSVLALAMLALVAACTSGAGGTEVSTVAVRLSGGPSAGELSFVPITSIDQAGNDIPPPSADSVLTPQGDGTFACPAGLAIGVVGPPIFEEISTSLFDSVTLAVEQANAANPGCRLTVKEFLAPESHLERLETARTIVADPSVLGLIGPFFREQTDAMGDRLSEAGLAFATPNLQVPSVSSHDWNNFVRGIPNDNQAATAVANYLTKRLGLTRICVVAQEYPENITAAEIVTGLAGPAVHDNCSGAIGRDTANYDLAVEAVVASDAEAVYFAGYPEEAAGLIRLLRMAGFSNKFIGDQGVRDVRFIQSAGDNTIGALVLGADLPPTVEFSDAFSARFGNPPEPYSSETYELTSIMINGIGSGTVTDRASMIEYLRSFDGYGSTRHYRWDGMGDLTDPDVWVHEVA